MQTFRKLTYSLQTEAYKGEECAREGVGGRLHERDVRDRRLRRPQARMGERGHFPPARLRLNSDSTHCGRPRSLSRVACGSVRSIAAESARKARLALTDCLLLSDASLAWRPGVSR